MRFRISGEIIGYGAGFISITMDILILYLFCYLLSILGNCYVSEKHILNALVLILNDNLWNTLCRLC